MEDVQIDTNANERIGFWTRLGAYAIDYGIVMISGVILGLFVGEHIAPMLFGKQMADIEESGRLLGSGFSDIMNRFMEIISGTAITGLSLIIMEGAIGQSFGKMILKIIITNEDGSKASPQTLWTRAFLKYGASLVSLVGSIAGLLFLTIIASLWSLVIFVGFFLVFMDNKQTIHDMIAKTVVSRK